MKKCPFCAEEIQDEAIKCKHCGEMLNAVNTPPNHTDYKQVKKGIKQVELDKMAYGVNLFFNMVIGIIVGWIAGSMFGTAWGWSLGIAICLAMDVKSAKKYYELGRNKK